MHRKRIIGCLLILPTLAAGVLLMAGLAVPLSSAQGTPDLAVQKYIPASETDPFARDISFSFHAIPGYPCLAIYRSQAQWTASFFLPAHAKSRGHLGFLQPFYIPATTEILSVREILAGILSHSKGL